MQKEFADADCELSEMGKEVFSGTGNSRSEQGNAILACTNILPSLFFISESQKEYREAQAILDEYDAKEVSLVVSHKFCVILLNCGVSYT